MAENLEITEKTESATQYGGIPARLCWTIDTQ